MKTPKKKVRRGLDFNQAVSHMIAGVVGLEPPKGVYAALMKRLSQRRKGLIA